MPSNIVLSYHDCVLHESDLEILRRSEWLNDEIIAFYLEYLEKEVYPPASHMLFISPQVTQCLKQVDNAEVKLFLDPVLTQQHHYIFFALNDSDSLDRPGGSHWSLLIYNRRNDEYFHVDSSHGGNVYDAKKLANNLNYYFNNNDNQQPFVKQVQSTQQNNSYDCGLYLLSNIEQAIRLIQANRPLDVIEIDPHNIKQKRASIITLIFTLKKKCEK